jgi:hypothetical protein
MLTMALVLSLASAAGPPPKALGRWKVEIESGRTIVFQAGDRGASALALLLRCKVEEKKLLPGVKFTGRNREAYFVVGRDRGVPPDHGDVIVNFDDDAQPEKYYATRSTDGGSLFINFPDAFIRTMLKHSTASVVVKLSHRDAMPAVSFDLAGLRDALAPLLEQCPMKEK